MTEQKRTLTSLLMKQRLTNEPWFQKAGAVLGAALSITAIIAIWWLLVIGPLSLHR